jgi:hypothetical protein
MENHPGACQRPLLLPALPPPSPAAAARPSFFGEFAGLDRLAAQKRAEQAKQGSVLGELRLRISFVMSIVATLGSDLACYKKAAHAAAYGTGHPLPLAGS